MKSKLFPDLRPVDKWIAILFIVAALLACVVLSSRILLFAEGVPKVDVCHVTDVPGVGDGHVITIADPAWPAHFDHGDAQVGDVGVIVFPDGTCHVE